MAPFQSALMLGNSPRCDGLAVFSFQSPHDAFEKIKCRHRLAFLQHAIACRTCSKSAISSPSSSARSDWKATFPDLSTVGLWEESQAACAPTFWQDLAEPRVALV